MIYIYIFIFLFCCSVLEIANVKGQPILRFLVCATLVMFAGLRYETGGDWTIYEGFFEDLDYAHSRGLEIGYLLLCHVVKSLGGDIQVVFFVVVLFNICMIYNSLKVYTKYVITGLMVYYSVLYFSFEMMFVRQSIAVSICFYAMRYVKDKKIIKFFAFVLLASLSHRVSLLMIPLYFILRKNLSSQFIFSVIFVGAVIMFFNVQWISGVIKLVSPFLSEYMQEKLNDYSSIEMFSVSRSIGVGFFFNFFLLIVFLLCRKYMAKNEYATVFLNMYFISMISFYWLFEVTEVSTRIRLLYMISIIVLFPLMIEIMADLKNKVMLLSFLSLYGLLYSKAVFFNQPLGMAYQPYQNYIIYKITDKKSTGKERLNKSNELFKEDKLKEER